MKRIACELVKVARLLTGQDKKEKAQELATALKRVRGIKNGQVDDFSGSEFVLFANGDASKSSKGAQKKAFNWDVAPRKVADEIKKLIKKTDGVMLNWMDTPKAVYEEQAKDPRTGKRERLNIGFDNDYIKFEVYVSG